MTLNPRWIQQMRSRIYLLSHERVLLNQLLKAINHSFSVRFDRGINCYRLGDPDQWYWCPEMNGIIWHLG